MRILGHREHAHTYTHTYSGSALSHKWVTPPGNYWKQVAGEPLAGGRTMELCIVSCVLTQLASPTSTMVTCRALSLL